MEKTITLQLPSTPLSIMQWKSDLQSMIEDNHSLFLINDVNDIPTQSELVLMGRDLNTNILKTLINLLTKHNVSKAQLSHLSQVEEVDLIRLSLDTPKVKLVNEMKQFATEVGCDFALVNELPDFAKPGLVLMDMDSTTIQIECIDEIARLYGVGEQVSAVTAAAMRGELDFNESLRTRVSKLANAPESVIKEVADNMPLMPGLLALIAGLKAANWKVAIASGGFTYFANRLKDDHGFDAAYANTLEIANNTLTGEVTGEIVNADVKARTLKELADKFSIPSSQTVAIGDGANDLVMMAASSLGIAIHAKPVVQEKASVALNNLDLEGALGLLTASLPLS